MLLEFGASFDRSANPNDCFVIIVEWDWLICQYVHQIQMIPDVVKFQSKGFEIKSTVKTVLKSN